MDYYHRFGGRFRCPASCLRLNLTLAFGIFGLYLLNQFIFKQIGPSFFRFYFNDLLAMPLLLAYSNSLYAIFGKTKYALATPIRILALTLFAALVWEAAAPIFIERSIGDLLDVGAYLVGGALYYMWLCVLSLKGEG